VHNGRDDAREALAARYDQAADELEAAVHHLRTAAQRFRDADVPRGCAHAFAAYGHMHTAQGQIDLNAVIHASKALR
jgi:hypothetical protein